MTSVIACTINKLAAGAKCELLRHHSLATAPKKQQIQPARQCMHLCTRNPAILWPLQLPGAVGAASRLGSFPVYVHAARAEFQKRQNPNKDPNRMPRKGRTPNLVKPSSHVYHQAFISQAARSLTSCRI